MKGNKAITLIALVITIIIMMILVGIVVTIAIKGNLFGNAKKGSEEYGEEQIRELLTPVISAMFIEDNNILEKDKTEIEVALNRQLNDENKKAQVPFKTDKYVYIKYDGYICVVDRVTAEIVSVKKANADYIGNGKNIDGMTIEEINDMAKTVEYKFKGQEINGAYNVVYSSDETTINSGSGEQTWDVNEVKLATEIYCANNVMIYDGTSPYVPVMVRFYRKDENTWTRSRGLNYFKVLSPTKMTFTTNNENNDWAFVDDSSYNYEATSNRKCASSEISASKFSDKTSGHYYASGRLTYTEEPTELLTNLGAFSAMSIDQDGNTKTFSIGNNYVVDVTKYYSTLQEGQDLINSVENNTNIATEFYELSKSIVEASYADYTFDDAESFAIQIDEQTSKVREAIDNLNNAIDSLPHISDEVLATVKLAKETEVKITTKEISGAYNVVYSSDETTINSSSGEQTWDVNGVKLAAEIYCANNIMIYDGTSPYVPVMVRFYRKNENTKRSRGLKYFKIDSPTNVEFSTNSNNNWEFVSDSSYNYEATSDRKCRSTENGDTQFVDAITGHYYASGRLTYTEQPTQILTDLGTFTATCCDQDGNTKTFSVGSNYVIDVTGYYNKISEAKELLTIENLYYDAETTYDLACLINELRNKEYTYSDANQFANEIQEGINNLENIIQKLKQ